MIARIVQSDDAEHAHYPHHGGEGIFHDYPDQGHHPLDDVEDYADQAYHPLDDVEDYLTQVIHFEEEC